MQVYDIRTMAELRKWQKRMQSKPGLINSLAKKIQVRINKFIPEKVHQAITTTMKQMVRAVLFGAKYTTGQQAIHGDLETIELVIHERIKLYRNTAMIEGGITGAGGILLGLADFPLLLVIKIKLLFDIASLYGFDTNDYRERLYLLHIFQLAYTSDEERKKVYLRMTDWDEKSKQLPEDIHQFDWRTFQQEYRDYIDLAKMAQLVPIIGAPVGVIANYRLIKKLGITAMNAYRMRLFNNAPPTVHTMKKISSFNP